MRQTNDGDLLQFAMQLLVAICLFFKAHLSGHEHQMTPAVVTELEYWLVWEPRGVRTGHQTQPLTINIWVGHVNTALGGYSLITHMKRQCICLYYIVVSPYRSLHVTQSYSCKLGKEQDFHVNFVKIKNKHAVNW